MGETTLLGIAYSAEYVDANDNGYGMMYRFYEWVITPHGKRLPLYSSWIIRYQTAIPAFVTAYPQTRPYGGKVV